MKAYQRVCALILALLVCAFAAGWPRAAAFGLGFGLPSGEESGETGGGETGGGETGSGETGGTAGGEGTAVKYICLVGNPDPLATELVFLNPEEEGWAAELEEQLPQTEPSLVVGLRPIYFCPVTWTLTGLDPQQPGRQFVSGQLKPETGYALCDGVSDTVTYPVYFTGGTQTQTETLDSWSTGLTSSCMALVAMNGDLSSLELQLQGYEAQCLTADGGGSFTCPLKWDFSKVDLTVPGVYTATAEVVLPAGFAPPADASPITAAIGVVDPDAVDLSAHCITEYGNLECDYLYVPALSTVKVEYAVGDGDWTEDPGELNAGHLRGYYFEMGNSFLIFFLDRLEAQTDYHFRVLYGDGLVSNEITIRLEEQGSTAPLITMGGNRDGSQDNSLPDLVQPIPGDDSDDDSDDDSGQAGAAETAPTSPANTAPEAGAAAPAEPKGPVSEPQDAVPEPESTAPAGLSAVLSSVGKAAAILTTPARADEEPAEEDAKEDAAPEAEVVTDTYTILSGQRVRQLLSSDQGTVLFEKGGVSVELTRTFLTGLALGDADLLQVTVEQPAADSFRLEVTAAGQACSSLDATTVHLRWKEDQKDNLECVDAKKAHVSDAAYDKATQTVACTIYAPGTYSIRSVPEAGTATHLTAPVPAASQRRQFPKLAAAALTAAAALGGTGAFLALRRRHE
jgi:hypothetical protein